MSVRVVARIRPLLAKEIEKDIIVHVDSSEQGRPPNVVKIPSPKNEAEEFSFTFNSVYDRPTTQEELFNAEVAPHIKSLFQGLDITIFAYGVTGTGKTHTMRGGLKLADRGVIPRLLSLVFRRGKKIEKDSAGLTTVDVALSYYEIYNDKVFDLLEPPEKRLPAGLPLRLKDNRTHVVGLSEQACADLRDFERLYIAANHNRVTAATKLNAHSSRSHAILRVKVTQTTRDADGQAVVCVRESTASAIDLAGSEDNRRTDNGRERLVESAAINKSLFVLSQCVDAIARGERRIPYRESKMTRILSLGQNNGITIMILNLAPVRSYHLDTLSSLNVSSRAKRIEVREIENEVVFRMPPRSLSGPAAPLSASAAASALAPPRQPLRALTSNAHNIQSGLAAAKAADKPDKPVKAFSVFTDRGAVAAAAKSALPLPPSPRSPAGPASAASSRMGPLSQLRRVSSDKRPSDPAEARPSKLARPSIHAHSAASMARGAPAPFPASAPSSASSSAAASTPMFSAAQIEAIVERKVAEALAARERERAEQDKPEQHAAVQKRLDALERRIEDSTRAGDEGRAEGLRCLLMARQHKEAGNDAAALRCYEQALPFFPGQPKLLNKMSRLRAKLAAAATDRADSASAMGLRSTHKRKRLAASVPSSPAKPAKVVKVAKADGDDDDASAATDADVEDDDADNAPASAVAAARARSSHRRALRSRSRGRSLGPGRGRGRDRGASPCVKDYDDADADADADDNNNNSTEDADDADDESRVVLLTPRKRRLLDIVNSRDVARIGSLPGVGAKKAHDLVAYLEAQQRKGAATASAHTAADSALDDIIVQVPTPLSLAQLRAAPGMGGLAVETACEGLVAL